MKKKITMLCMSALVVSSLTACDFDGGKQTTKEDKAAVALKDAHKKNVDKIDSAIRKIKLPDKKQYELINGARAVMDGKNLLVIYDFVDKDNKYYNLLIKEGTEEYKREAALQSVKKKLTKGKKEYLLQHDPDTQVKWIEDGKFYTLISHQIDEKKMENIVDSMTEDKEAGKLLDYHTKKNTLPTYITKDSEETPRRTVVEYIPGEKDLAISVGNQYATVTNAHDADMIKGQFERIKEYKQHNKDVGLPKGHKLGDGHDHENQFYDSFKKLELTGAEGYIQGYDTMASEAFVKKGDKYYHVRIDGNSLKKKAEEIYFFEETKRVVAGL